MSGLVGIRRSGGFLTRIKSDQLGLTRIGAWNSTRVGHLRNRFVVEIVKLGVTSVISENEPHTKTAKGTKKAGVNHR